MQAIVKKEDTIIINGVDTSERILIESFVNKSKEENKVIKTDTILDINGDTAGMIIKLIETQEENASHGEDSEELEENIPETE